MRSILLCTALVLIATCWIRADMQGAAAVLKRIARGELVVPGESGLGAGAALRSELAAFAADRAAMRENPTAAATKWVSLLSRAWQLDGVERIAAADPATGQMLGFEDFLDALPPPEAWDELESLARNSTLGDSGDEVGRKALALFTSALVGDLTSEDFQGVRDAAEKLDSFARDQVLNSLRNSAASWSLLAGDREGIKTAFRDAIAYPDEFQSWRPQLEVPDLVTLLGADDAEALLREALLDKTRMIEVRVGDETEDLARALALREIDRLNAPQWILAQTLHATALYEALDKKFPGNFTPPDPEEDSATGRRKVTRVRSSKSGTDDPWQEERTKAGIFHVLGLVAQGEVDRAKVAALTLSGTKGEEGLPADALRAFEKTGHLDELREFLDALLATQPDLPLWDHYIEISARTDRAQDALARVRESVAVTNLPVERREELDGRLATALLAAGEAEESIKILKRLSSEAMDEKLKCSVLGRLVHLGDVLDRDELFDVAMGGARQLLTSQAQGEFPSAEFYVRDLAGKFADADRFVDAEWLGIELLELKTRKLRSSPTVYAGLGASHELALLVKIYHRAGRHEDVLKLADEAAEWGCADLTDLVYGDASQMSAYLRKGQAPIEFCMADALVHAGRTNEALRVLETILLRRGGYDPAYAAYVRIKGLDAQPFLDQLASRDRFEERPLIWKAHVLREAGQLDEAEAAAKAAIAIDPSDGEQGRGDRMRAYAELGQIMAARGDTNKAAFYGDVIKAIRLAEDADEFYDAGLLTRGVEMYRQSLEFFKDAYCIQSRLAIQLDEMGRFPEAAEHYQRAYELMPDSFGRVESHCFGCEGVFGGERAQGIAERVFTSLLKESPDRPQLHYLMGYLRQEQERYQEAVALYRETVKLDPDYLNAWKKIGEIGKRLHLPAADRDAAVFAGLRLDPFGRHGTPALDQVVDVRQLVERLPPAEDPAMKKPDSLYPFAASAKRLKEQENVLGLSGMRGYRSNFGVMRGGMTVKDVLQAHDTVGPIVRVLSQAQWKM